ncbi:putative ERGIC-53 like protein [Blattamonas nauphoetae]|uniref:ERGIC-53 like protein n=1 Tax=Blattamonas nauphoetae TaxID=2049346 RepID=A0ABQ9X2D0_9EUKA|nr:putative ERGIC-53 like protein [Blattamonas nauphoetae]
MELKSAPANLIVDMILSVLSFVSISFSLDIIYLHPPLLTGRDSGFDRWRTGGRASVTNEQVSLTPLSPSSRGLLYSFQPSFQSEWEATFSIKISGSGRVGGEGMAFWYTQQPLSEGPVYGAADKWTGLSVILDVYDNDNKRNNPYILAMMNDGTKVYDHDNDGITQELAGCICEFRNSKSPAHFRVIYSNRTLSVFSTEQLRSRHSRSYASQPGDAPELFDGKQMKPLFCVTDLDLPSGYYFGFSASTGDVFDEHVLYSTSITTPVHTHPTDVFTKSAIKRDEPQSTDPKSRSPHTTFPRTHRGDAPPISSQTNPELKQVLQELNTELTALENKIKQVQSQLSKTPSSSSSQKEISYLKQNDMLAGFTELDSIVTVAQTTETQPRNDLEELQAKIADVELQITTSMSAAVSNSYDDLIVLLDSVKKSVNQLKKDVLGINELSALQELFSQFQDVIEKTANQAKLYFLLFASTILLLGVFSIRSARKSASNKRL